MRRLGRTEMHFACTIDGVEYFYFPEPYPNMRVKADWASIQDLSAYEGFTCLKAGSNYDPKTDAKFRLIAAADGKLRMGLEEGNAVASGGANRDAGCSRAS